MAIVNQGWAFVSASSAHTDPGGSDTNIQFNNNGTFSGSSLLITDGSGSLTASVNIAAAAFYGDGSNITGVTASAVNVADGPEQAIQFRVDTPVSGEISGSNDLMFLTASNVLALTGTMEIVGGLSVTTGLTITGSLIVSGSNTITNYGSFVSNEAGGDYDFRVESNNSQNMLFVDGGTDRVGINQGTPSASLHLYAQYGGPLVQIDAYGVPVFEITGGLSPGDGTTIVTGDLEVCAGTASIAHLTGCSPIQVHAPMQMQSGDSLAFDGATNTFKITNNGTNLDVNGANINLNATTTTLSGDLSVCAGTASIAHLSGCSPIQVHAPMEFASGTTLTTSTIIGGSPLSISASTITITGSLVVSGSNTITNYGAFTSNEAGEDYDFRVESNNSQNMLFVDGGTDRVGINQGTPSASLHLYAQYGGPLVQIDAYGVPVFEITGGLAPGDGTTIVTGDLEVCAGTASIAHLSGCSPIQVHAPMIVSGGALTPSGSESILVLKNTIDDGTANRTMLRLHNYRSDEANTNDFGPISIDFNIENLGGGSKTGIARIAAVQAPVGTDHTIPSGEKSSGLIFSTMAGNTLAESMRIDASGNVGIGTQAPSASLHVVGEITASANISASAFIFGPGGRQQISDTSTDMSILAASTGMFISADGGNLTLQGQVAIDTAGVVSSSQNISASAFYGDGSHLTNIPGGSTVDTTTDTSNATFYVPFVNQSTGQSGETVYIHDVLSLNPSSSLVQISETGQKTAELRISSSIGNANAFGGKYLGQISFPGAPGSDNDALTIAGGYINMGGGNLDALQISAIGDVNSIMFVTSSNRLILESSTVSFKGDIESDGPLTVDDEISGSDVLGATATFGAIQFQGDGEVRGTEGTFKLGDNDLTTTGTGQFGPVVAAGSITVSGASDTGLMVTSKLNGGASITSIGHILAGVSGPGVFAAAMFASGEVTGSGDLNIGGAADIGGIVDGAGGFSVNGTVLVDGSRNASGVNNLTVGGVTSLEGNVTLGDATGDEVTWKGNNCDFTNSNKVWKLADGSDGFGGNGPLLIFTGSGGDILKFSTSGSRKGVVFPTTFYPSNNDSVSIGDSTYQFKHLFLSKTATVTDVSASANVSASYFYGDGSNLTNVAGGGGGIFTESDVDKAYTTSSVTIGSSATPLAVLQVSSSTVLPLIDARHMVNSNPALFVTQSGRVGIGTDDPDYALDVNGYLALGNGSGTGYIISRGDTDTYIRFGHAGSDSMQFYAGGKSFIEIDENGVDKVVLGTAAADLIEVTGTLKVFGDAQTTGAVGIGIPSDAEPHVTLDVHYTGSKNPINLSNDTGGGEVVYFGTASAALNTGGLYYLNSDGGWATAGSEATGSGHNQLLGISIGSKPKDDGMLIKGFFDADSHLSGAFIKGAPLYVQSSSVSRARAEGGYLSGAAPTAADSYVRVLGYGTDTANVIYFNPDSTYVEIGS